MERKTAGFVIIGDEVLSARIAEANLANLLTTFAGSGVAVGEVAILPDDADRIATVVRDFAHRFDVVVTTGGVGPTHDDLTWEAVGAAFSRPLALHEEMLRWMEARNGRPMSTEQQRMAWLPVGTEIVQSAPDGRGFMLHLENVWVLPGVPAMVRAKIGGIARRYASAPAWVATARYDVDEWEVVAAIDATVQAHGDVQIGSYPIFDATDHRLKLTFVCDDRVAAERALAEATAGVGSERLVDVVWHGGPAAIEPSSNNLT